ncbi:glycosyltransferase family 2 protein [Clostridium botulinum]|nr:glycosyltransferase family 2 protein [Clostridium botulinum]
MSIIQNTLSICIISKNEEKNIEKCIKSVIDIADEIVLVDTGSTDNTIDIAKNLGVKVIEHPWNNDFSEARNVSINNATKDWILFLDCDEELPSIEGQKLKSLINDEENSKKFEAFYLRLVNIIQGVQVSDAIVLRAFKNKPEYRFKGKMHEQIINSIQNAKGLNSIGATPIEIYHYGYDPDVSDTDKKSKRNLELLLSYDEKDKDGYYYYVLGNEYARVDNYDQALKIYNYSLNKTNAKMFNYIYYPYLVMNIIKIYFAQKRFNDCIKAIDKFKETLPHFKDMYFIECLSYIEMSKLSKASEALDKYLNCPQGSYEYPSNNYENFHDIPKLVIDLNNGMVPHGDKMLSVWIPMDNWDENIIECIKSVNEIASEVIIITTSPKKLDINRIQQIGGKVLILSPNNSNKLYKMANNWTRGKYVLLMYPNEICSHVTQIQLCNLLNDEEYTEDAFLLRILDMDTQNYELRLSLFKTNKKVSSLEEYNKYLASKNFVPYDIEILIHSRKTN